MPLPPPRPRSHRFAATVAVAVGAVSLVAALAVAGVTLWGGARPEEDVAVAFLDAVVAGDGEAAYALTTPGYRTLVTSRDVDALVAQIAAVAGPDATIEILGSERTPGTAYPESLVGYHAATAVGRMEGVVTLVQREADLPWEVRDLSFRFPEADAAATADLEALTRQLNEQLSERASTLTDRPG